MFKAAGFFFGQSLIQSWRTKNTFIVQIRQLDYKYDNIQHALLGNMWTTLTWIIQTCFLKNFK